MENQTKVRKNQLWRQVKDNSIFLVVKKRADDFWLCVNRAGDTHKVREKTLRKRFYLDES